MGPLTEVSNEATEVSVTLQYEGNPDLLKRKVEESELFGGLGVTHLNPLTPRGYVDRTAMYDPNRIKLNPSDAAGFALRGIEDPTKLYPDIISWDLCSKPTLVAPSRQADGDFLSEEIAEQVAMANPLNIAVFDFDVAKAISEGNRRVYTHSIAPPDHSCYGRDLSNLMENDPNIKAAVRDDNGDAIYPVTFFPAFENLEQHKHLIAPTDDYLARMILAKQLEVFALSPEQLGGDWRFAVDRHGSKSVVSTLTDLNVVDSYPQIIPVKLALSDEQIKDLGLIISEDGMSAKTGGKRD